MDSAVDILDLLYKGNGFEFSDFQLLCSFTTHVPQRYLDLVKHVKLRWPTLPRGVDDRGSYVYRPAPTAPVAEPFTAVLARFTGLRGLDIVLIPPFKNEIMQSGQQIGGWQYSRGVEGAGVDVVAVKVLYGVAKLGEEEGDVAFWREELGEKFACLMLGGC